MEPRKPDDIELVIEPQKRFSIDFPELWQYRELFYFFAWRDVKVKYKQTVLGVLWVVLQPLVMMMVFTLIFRVALGVQSAGMDYTVFAFSGLLLWNLFSSSVNSAGTSMVTNAPIIKKIYFPRLIIPCASILVSFVDFLVSVCIFIVLLIIKSAHVNFLLLVICWPLSLLLTLFATLGLSSWLAALSVKYRDFRFIVPFMIQFGFFVTPVAYPVSMFKTPWIEFVLALNPMFGAITLFRAPFSDVPINLMLVSISLGSALFFTVIGLYYFRQTESTFADIA